MVKVNSKDGSVICTTGNENFSMVKVISNHYKVTTRVQLDRESRSSHVIVVVCEDQLNRSSHVEEGTEVGTFIFNAVATDLDLKENGEISYYTSPTHSGFRIDPVSGEVFTTMRQDREMRSQVTFEVIAQDGGIKRLKTSVTINITDINDNSPVFPRPEFSFYVSKRSLVGTDVGHVFAFDVDVGLNGP
ncbi:unnamed protein product [Mytilus coruscus]|uniref:Cadherin domain-containing protein n=1 Tax=Mytilus coruscus TaxID=42192 RepID=A0A6J8C682_MYTCO|nr:unnamed protein product [Mytilus coruscus]